MNPPDLPELWVVHAGLLPYADALELQHHVRDLRAADRVPDVLLLLEHPPVYTRGRRSRPEELPLDEAWYRERGIAIVPTDRGGRVTYHGPGQIVGYPIMVIDDVLRYVRTMEAALIAALGDVDISAEVRRRLTGVWVDDRKIGSIGVHVARGITTHGFAINVDNDLEPFSWIVPCGIDGVQMTSVSAERGRSDLMAPFARAVAARFAAAYERRARSVALSALPPVAASQPAPAAAVESVPA